MVNKNSNVQPMSKLEEKSLIKSAQDGCFEARNLLWESNMDYAHALVRKYFPHIDNLSLEYCDLFQEADFAFNNAIYKFDCSKNNRLMTFAFPKIRKAVQKYIYSCGRFITIPKNVDEDYSKIQKATRDFENKMILHPTVKQLAQATGLTEKRVNKVCSTMLCKNYIYSLDACIEDDPDNPAFMDYVVSPYDCVA